jgi:hypothetical protein
MFKFKPENELERALVRATVNPSLRPRFYREFMRATVFFVQHDPTPPGEGRTTLRKGTTVKLAPIQVEGRPYLPVFSSSRRLADSVRNGTGCVGINALEFLKLTRGMELVLNPGSGFGKIFTREEIDAILDGSAVREETPPGRPGGPPATEPPRTIDN